MTPPEQDPPDDIETFPDDAPHLTQGFTKPGISLAKDETAKNAIGRVASRAKDEISLDRSAGLPS